MCSTWGQRQKYGHQRPQASPGFLVALRACRKQVLTPSYSLAPFQAPGPITRAQRPFHELENTFLLQHKKLCCFLGSPHWNYLWRMQKNRKAVFSWRHMENSLFARKKIITCCLFFPQRKIKTLIHLVFSIPCLYLVLLNQNAGTERKVLVAEEEILVGRS
jgi:hypothetical protein